MYELTRDKYLLAEELIHLQALLDRTTGRDSTMLKLFLATGARGSEMAKVHPSDFTRSDLTVYIRATKSSRDRLLPIPQPLFIECEKLFIPGKPVFDISIRQMRHIWDQYRPVKKGLHSLRHTAAFRLYDKTRDIKLVQTFLGHRSLINTQIYADFITNTEQLRKALVG